MTDQNPIEPPAAPVPPAPADPAASAPTDPAPMYYSPDPVVPHTSPPADPYAPSPPAPTDPQAYPQTPAQPDDPYAPYSQPAEPPYAAPADPYAPDPRYPQQPDYPYRAPGQATDPNPVPYASAPQPRPLVSSKAGRASAIVSIVMGAVLLVLALAQMTSLTGFWIWMVIFPITLAVRALRQGKAAGQAGAQVRILAITGIVIGVVGGILMFVAYML